MVKARCCVARLKPLFITAYNTGIRKGELLSITWPQVDFESRLITLEYGETKNQEARSVPIGQIPIDLEDGLVPRSRIKFKQSFHDAPYGQYTTVQRS
jgi:integrase